MTNQRRTVNKYLKRLKNGEKCLDEFFHAVSGHVKYIAYTHLTDKSFVDDVVLRTFEKILDNIQSFDENNNGMAWISKIAKNEAYTVNILEKRHQHVSLDDISKEVACTEDRINTIVFTADLHRVMNGLKERERQIVTLRVFEGFTFQEIAKKLDMHVGTVYKHFKAALKKISKEIL